MGFHTAGLAAFGPRLSERIHPSTFLRQCFWRAYEIGQVIMAGGGGIVKLDFGDRGLSTCVPAPLHPGERRNRA